MIVQVRQEERAVLHTWIEQETSSSKTLLGWLLLRSLGIPGADPSLRALGKIGGHLFFLTQWQPLPPFPVTSELILEPWSWYWYSQHLSWREVAWEMVVRVQVWSQTAGFYFPAPPRSAKGPALGVLASSLEE